MTRSKTSLRRELTQRDLIIIGIGGAVGTGVLFGTAGMAAVAGPGVIVAWLLGGLMYLTVGLTYIDLNRLYPEEGGPSRYSLYTFGHVTNMLNALCDIIWYLFIPPIEALGVVEGLNFFYPHFVNSSGNPTMLGAILGVLFMLAFFPFNYYGVKFFSKNTNFYGGLKLILYLTVALGFISFGHFSNFSAHGGFAPFGMSGIFLAIPLGMFGFGSLRVIPDYAEEVKDVSVISKAILWSLLGQTVLYVLFGVALVAALDWRNVKVAVGHWAGLTSIPGNPFLVMAEHSNVPWLIGIVVVIAIIGPFVTGYIYQGGGSRILFAMGRSKIVSKKMTALSRDHGIPVRSLVVTTVVGVIIAFIAAPAPSIYALLGDAVVAGYLGFAVNPPIMIALRKQGTTGYFRSPVVSQIVASLAFASASLIVYWSGWPSVPYASVLVFALAIILAVTNNVNKNFINSIWYIGYILFLSVMTYLGSEGALKVLSFGWGSIIVIFVSVLIFLPWGVASRLDEAHQPKFVAPVS
ncbi:APC family permease [Acidithiobacillus sp. AMEEHan]|uniref:APC family permease n=1 Tax=Acidithiobacillus sp. AMEEHan TaxID=2994951 RepID=UPI0027E400AC|nr:APC family permease [Acidithiobacillus sp. AMEEHan]